MADERILFLSVPGLRVKDITQEDTPTLHAWANQGGIANLVPSFPCVTSPVQATFLTGRSPGQHGVIANGFYHRDRKEVEFWVAHNSIIEGEQTWDRLRQAGLSAAAWHTQNIKGAAADFIITPSPIHEDDGTTKLWCYEKPEGLYTALIDEFGHFPLQHYWGPLSNIESTKWILKGARWLIEKHDPRFHWIYIPQLDYAAQKHGPDSKEARQALVELEAELALFATDIGQSKIAENATFIVASEYAMTDVARAIHPNRLLRDAGMVKIRPDGDQEQLDIPGSRAFAMVDHQFAHIFVSDPADVHPCAELFRNVPGIADALAGDERSKVGLDHPRSGEIILIAEPDHWFTYYFWMDEACAPAYARTVDIHAKPGYDPVEMFVDPATRAISLNSSLVKGSHGAPALEERQFGAILASRPGIVSEGRNIRDTDVHNMCLNALGIS
ncbi:MAG: alkaline phosphatase family protein [Phycisphaerae bacterium]